MTIESMQFHGPGWNYRDEDDTLYQLWAPQDGAIPDPFDYARRQRPGYKPRDFWQAAWQTSTDPYDEADMGDGYCVRAVSDDEAMAKANFPDAVRRMFKLAVAHAIDPAYGLADPIPRKAD